MDVGRHEARDLWQVLADVVERTCAPQIDSLVLDGSLAVALVQSRSHRVVGRAETTLSIGLPLVEALPTSEVRALLALELAGRRHVRRNDGGAERVAAELAGTVVVAAAIVRAELVRRVLDDDYWPAVFHGAQSSAHPRVKPFSSVRRTLRAHVESGALRAHAGRLFGVDAIDENGMASSLGQRLRAIGVSPLDAVDAALLPVAAPAADLLGRSYATLLARLDEFWSERVDEWWKRAHEEALREALGAEATPARTWTQATALASYSDTFERVPSST